MVLPPSAACGAGVTGDLPMEGRPIHGRVVQRFILQPTRATPACAPVLLLNTSIGRHDLYRNRRHEPKISASPNQPLIFVVVHSNEICGGLTRPGALLRTGQILQTKLNSGPHPTTCPESVYPGGWQSRTAYPTCLLSLQRSKANYIKAHPCRAM